jgi:putative ABC transport system ATP-binding protein
MTVSELRAEGLSVDGGDRRVVDALDLQVRGGELLGLSGPTASGKTTLVYALAGLTAPAAGRLLVDGRPAVPWREISTAIVFQNLCLVAMLSAEETVALPLQAAGVPARETRARAGDALERLGLADHVGQLVATLSGGQRQRVAVARALAAQPDLLLADEPTSALDETLRDVVLAELVAQARRGAIVIVASGDTAVTAACDRVIELAPATRPREPA